MGTRYLIIGAGIAGSTAAEAIRERDKEGEITLISGEPELVYSRILLTKFFKGKLAREKLFLKTLKAQPVESTRNLYGRPLSSAPAPAGWLAQR